MVVDLLLQHIFGVCCVLLCCVCFAGERKKKEVEAVVISSF